MNQGAGDARVAPEGLGCRYIHPNKGRFAVMRILGSRDHWITEFILSHDVKPSYEVSIMEFHDGAVVRDTQFSLTDSIRLHYARFVQRVQ
jgi:hypothetical protein